MKRSNYRYPAICFCLISIIFTFSSCKKQNELSVDSTVPNSISIDDLNPFLKITPLNINIELTPDLTGSSSQEMDLDINSDKNPDFKIKIQCDFDSPSKPSLTSQVDIQALNTSSFVLLDTSFIQLIKYVNGTAPICIKNSAFCSPKILSKGDQINLIDNWEDQVKPSRTLVGTFYFDVKDPFAYYMIEGMWKDVEEKYIGIRYENYLGWIKLSIPKNHNKLIIHEVALYRYN
jgi:hypothetical protein